MEKQMEYLRYNSFLNAINREFKGSAEGIDKKTQRKMLSLATRIVDGGVENGHERMGVAASLRHLPLEGDLRRCWGLAIGNRSRRRR